MLRECHAWCTNNMILGEVCSVIKNRGPQKVLWSGNEEA